MLCLDVYLYGERVYGESKRIDQLISALEDDTLQSLSKSSPGRPGKDDLYGEARQSNYLRDNWPGDPALEVISSCSEMDADKDTIYYHLRFTKEGGRGSSHPLASCGSRLCQK